MHAAMPSMRSQGPRQVSTERNLGNRTVTAGTLVLAIVAAAFGKSMLAEGVSLGDVLLACALLLHALSLSAGERVFHIPPEFRLLSLFAAWALVGALLLSSTSAEFSFVEFSKSFGRLLFCFAIALMVRQAARRLGTDAVARILKSLLLINAGIGLYVYVAMQSGDILPYGFFWKLQEGTEHAGYFGATQFVRLRGSFSEPAAFGIFHAFGVGALLNSQNKPVSLSRYEHALLALPLLLTFSLSTYILSTFVYAPLLFRLKFSVRSMRRALMALTLASAAVVGFTSIAPIADSFSDVVVDRLHRVFAGEDTSATSRLLASWELPFAIVTDSPWTGAGLGNVDVSFNRHASRLTFADLLEGRQGWNILAYILGSTGVIGLFIFLLFLVALLRRHFISGALFAASLFATGGFLEGVIWVFYGVFFVHSTNREAC